MPITLLRIENALLAIKKCNESRVFLGAESLVHQHFSRPEEVLDSPTIHERVVLLDAVWATQLFRDPGAHDRITGSLITHADQIHDAIGSLHQHALEQEPDRVVQASRVILQILLRTSEGKVGKAHYSFATKFMHWITRNHFPIVDSKARAAVNSLQRARQEPNRIMAHWVDPRDDYERWVQFYSRLLGAMSSEERARFHETDQQSQKFGPIRQNSLLRIWDKVFYQLGSDPEELRDSVLSCGG